MQQILLSFGKGEDAGWLIMSNYLTATPSNHNYYGGQATSLHRSHNGDKLYASEQWEDSNDSDAAKFGLRRIDLDGSNYTDLNYNRGLTNKANYSNRRDVYYKGSDIDSNDDLYYILNVRDGNGTNNYSYHHFEYMKYDTSASSHSWRHHIQGPAQWNSTGPRCNTGTSICVFKNGTKFRIEGGQFYSYWQGSGYKNCHTTGLTSDGRGNDDQCLTPADPGNETTRLHMMWGPMGRWGNQSNSNKVLFGAGQFIPPNSQPAACFGVWDGTSISNLYKRNDTTPYTNTPSKARYLRQVITRRDGSVGYICVQEYIMVNSVQRTIASITRVDSSFNRTNYQQEKTLDWNCNVAPIAVDDTGGSDDGCLYTVSRVTERVVLNGSDVDRTIPCLIKYDTSGNIDWIIKIDRPINNVGGNGVGLEGTYVNLYTPKVTVAQDGSPIIYGKCQWNDQPNNPNNNDATDRYDWCTPFYLKLPADGSFEGTIGSSQHEKWTITKITNWTASSQSDNWTTMSTSTNSESWTDYTSPASSSASAYGKTSTSITF